jgi:kynureninase
MNFENTESFAKSMDEKDLLKSFRDLFYIPIMYGKPAIYFTGNSLGLQPKTTQEYVVDELEDWANFGVEGHFHARKPWMPYHEIFPAQLSKL